VSSPTRPSLAEISAISSVGPDDAFIVCSSFEERCGAGAQKLADSYGAKVACVFRFMPSDNDEEGFEEARDRNTALLSKILSEHATSFPPIIIMCNRRKTQDGIGQLKTILSAHFPDGCKRVTLDISTFTKIYCWELLYYLVDICKVETLRIIYTKAGSFPGDSLTSGAYPNLLATRFSGRFSPAQQTLLLGFVGFEPQRAILIYEEFEPDAAEIFVSYTPEKPDYFARAVRANDYLITRPGVRWSKVEAYDFRKAVTALEDALRRSHLSRSSDSLNIVLVSLGTKVQNVAGYLFWQRHREVRLAYSFPTRYGRDHLRMKAGETLAFYFPIDKTETNGEK